MPVRHLPVCPNLDQLKHQAKDRLRVNAIWEDDIDTVRRLVTSMIHEDALILKNSNWGPPITYAANVGRDAIIRVLYDLGARDLRSAIDRATLQSKIGTARMLYEMAGRPAVPAGALCGSAYTLSAEGTAFALEVGAPVVDASGNRLAPVDVVLETDSRRPSAKHAILELYEKYGLRYPDTPMMALHRGRIDLLEAHIQRDPSVVNRTFSHKEIFPPEMGSKAELDATVGTPLDGTTLLHICVDYDEIEIGEWLISKGADVNARARVGSSGFGGYTPLFCTVVSQPNFWMNYRNRGLYAAPFTELLLRHGADPNVRASIWKQLHPGYLDSTRREYRDVTALSYSRQFVPKVFVSQPAMDLIAAAGGIE